jgi:NTE family protein
MSEVAGSRLPPEGDRVALILGAGGTVGEAFHAGTLAALAECGWDARSATMIAGTSTGAIVGATLRAGLSPQDLYTRVTGGTVSAAGRRLLARAGGWPVFPPPPRRRLGWPETLALWPALARRPWRIRPGILLAGVLRAGAVSPAPIAEGFNRLVGQPWPPEPLRVCAVDLDTGRRIVFGSGADTSIDVGTAVSASAAVPSYFSPVHAGGRRLVDGGCHSPVNADVIADVVSDLDAVIVSLPMGACGARLGADLPGRFLNHLFCTWELRPARTAGVRVTVFEPTASELQLMHYDAFDTRIAGPVAARAYASARERLTLAPRGRRAA